MSVKQLPNGRWQTRWRDDHGRQRAKVFRRKIDAEAFERDTLQALQRGTYLPPDTGKTTVREMAERWLDGAMNLGQGGQDTYRRDLDRYILPALGDLPLRRLSATAIDRFLSDELKGGLAPSSVHRHYRTIRRLCAVAVDRDQLRENPCAKVTPPKMEHTEMRFLTAEQVELLADAISPGRPGDKDPGRYRAWVHTAVYAGPRWSEAVGLQRSSIEGNKLTILGQLVRRSDGEWHRDAPKTRAGRRVVTLDDGLAAELADHMDRYGGPGRTGLVFPNSDGRPLNAPSFTGMVFKPALKRAGLDRNVRIHDLRHTAVALAIQAGAHPKAIQVRMGHASIMVTLDRYGHMFPEMDEELGKKLGDLRQAALGSRS